MQRMMVPLGPAHLFWKSTMWLLASIPVPRRLRCVYCSLTCLLRVPGSHSSTEPSILQEYATESGQEVLGSALNPTSQQAVSPGFGGRWTAYQSPLQSYPLSRWHLHLTGSSEVVNGSMTSVVGGHSILTSSGSFSSNSADGSSSADHKETTVAGNFLRSLKMVTLFKNLDPDRRICQFEIPGGGVCRDDKCEDLHIEKELEIWEPSGASRIF